MPIEGSLRISNSVVGTTLRGASGTQFHLRSLIGEGGQGWVFKANYDAPDGFWVVVKMLRPEGIKRESVERFEKESRVLQLLGAGKTQTPNIVRIYDHGIHQLRLFSSDLVLPFMVLEYVDGPTLTHIIHQSAGRGLPLDRIVRIMRQVARALTVIHEARIVHRDLKPSNILLSITGGQEIVKVTDFGLVKAPDLSARSTATLAGASLGYAPPEQYEMRNTRVSARTDVFSFAAIFFELCTGSPAFPRLPGQSPLQAVLRITEGPRPRLGDRRGAMAPGLAENTAMIAALDQELAAATDPNPDARQPSIMALWDALERIIQGATSGPTRATSSPSFPAISGPPIPSMTPKGTLLVPQFRVAVGPLSSDRVRSAAFSPRDGTVFALGLNGLYGAYGAGVGLNGDVRTARWTQIQLPRWLDVRRVRGLGGSRSGGVVLFGDNGLAATLGPVGFQTLAEFGPGLTWLSAFSDDGDCVLAGESTERGCGVIAEVTGAGAQVHFASGTERLHSVTRLASGALLACGMSDLIELRRATMEPQIVDVPWGKTGYLYALARTPTGGAFAVGSGGHALHVSPTVGGAGLAANLESVNTTKDLTAVSVDDWGTGFAVGHEGRLLERTGANWRRVSVPVSTNLSMIQLVGPRRYLLAEDGTLLVV